MSLHNGTAAETERKRMLEAEGHIILNLGQNQYGDLEDVCHDTIIEVKTSIHGRRKLSRKEKEQMANLLRLAPVWQSEFADRVVSSFKLRAIMNPPHDSVPEINSTLASNKNRKVKNGIHPEKTKGKKKEEAVEKVKP